MPVVSRIKESMTELRRPKTIIRPALPTNAVLKSHVAGTMTFLIGVLIAFLWSNTSAAPVYESLRDTPLFFSVGQTQLQLSFRSFVNEGLMSLFFFSMTLIMRRHLFLVSSSSRSPIQFSMLAAAGVVIVPALILRIFAGLPGFGVSLAIGGFDLGLALAVFAAAQKTPSLESHPLFRFSMMADIGWLTALLILGATSFSLVGIVGCAIAFLAVYSAWRLGVRGPLTVVLFAGILWLSWKATGFTPALAGVLVALLVPSRSLSDERKARDLAEETIDAYDRAMEDSDSEQRSAMAQLLGDIASSTESPMDRWHRSVLPWLVWIVLPLFGWVNGGVTLSSLSLGGPPLYLAAALLIGRPIGYFLFSWIAKMMDQHRGNNNAELDGKSSMELALVLNSVGIPAIFGAVTLFADSHMSGPFVFWLITLSLLSTLVSSTVLRYKDFD